jgi:uncharacterized protein (TIGR01777 family)
MKVLVTGSHGLVGSQLVQSLSSNGHQVVRLVRANPSEDQIVWDPRHGQIDKERLEGFDAVVHLAGENIASGRWTSAKKSSIRASRVEGTKLLCKALSYLSRPPKVLVCASAIGYYGDRGREVLTETSPAGSGFLAELCQEWESATEAAKQKNIRVVLLRIGVVLSRKGGALMKMLPPFKMGAGGKLGSGKQYMSWISLDDLIGSINHVLAHNELSGPVNAVAPNPVTNIQFTAALGASLRKPTIFAVPRFAAQMLLGEMADELLLSGSFVKPDKLQASGYTFKDPELAPMLQHLFESAP